MIYDLPNEIFFKDVVIQLKGRDRKKDERNFHLMVTSTNGCNSWVHTSPKPGNEASSGSSTGHRVTKYLLMFHYSVSQLFSRR